MERSRKGMRAAATRRSRGFTIVELMFVVLIITVLAALAAPTFTETARMDDLVEATDQVHRAFELARTRALMRGVAMRIIVRPTVAADSHTANIRVDESPNTSCNGWAMADDPMEVDFNQECDTWTLEPERCGVVRADVTGIRAPAVWHMAGIRFSSGADGSGPGVMVAGVPAADPLVLCVNRRGRLLWWSVTDWVEAGTGGQGVEIRLQRVDGTLVLAEKAVWVGQAGIPRVMR